MPFWRRSRAGLHAEVRVFGDVQFSRKLEGVGRRARRARPVFDAMGHRVLEIQQEQFQTSGGRSGRPWAPLEASTIRGKRARGSLTPTRPLEDTGALREAWRYGDANNVFEVTDDYIRVGVEGEAEEHGRWHQPDHKGRRVMDLTDADRRELVRDMQHWVVYGEVRY